MRVSIVIGVFVLFGMEAPAEDEPPLTEVSSQKLRLSSSSAVGGSLDIQLNRRLTPRPIQTDFPLTHLIIENSTSSLQ
jgi:hypothetical protein